MSSRSKRKRRFCLPPEREAIAAWISGPSEELCVVIDENGLRVTHAITP